ncbi:MAG: hypothetical protein ACLS49_00110 [Christensenellales bacterium]
MFNSFILFIILLILQPTLSYIYYYKPQTLKNQRNSLLRTFFIYSIFY